MKIYPIAEKINLLDLALPIPGFEQFMSCYVIGERKVALVDVGSSNCSQNLIRGLAELGIAPMDVEYIFITHIHIDHAGGLGKVLAATPGAKVVVHGKAKKHLVNPERLWQESRKVLGELADKYGPIYPVPEERIITPDEGETFKLNGDAELEVLFTPGHASHHLSFMERERGILFIGEVGGVYTLGKVRPSTPPPFDLEQTLSSIDKLAKLKPALLCYAHFGPTTDAIGKLHFYKSQLSLWHEVISEGINNGENSGEIYRKLLSQDENCAYVVKSPFGERERRLLLNSVEGFIQYLQKVGIEH
jgi:glyoxylase-like metal-dependent hydrolase (beta-lactamase superfamily II)